MAHAFHLEGERFTPRGSSEELATKKAALITLDSQVDETDRMLSAVVLGNKWLVSRKKKAFFGRFEPPPLTLPLGRREVKP